INLDPKLKKRVRKIKRNAYGKYTKRSELVGSLGLSITRHSRDKEFEADSIALRMYLNTSYSLEAPVRTLEILDSADMSPYRHNIDFKKHFAFKAHPFRDSWIDYTRSDRWHSSETNDSLQTHPSCTKRITAIRRQMAGLPSANRKPVNLRSDQCSEQRDRSALEIATSLYQYKDYGRSLFLFPMLADRYPQLSFNHDMIGQ